MARQRDEFSAFDDTIGNDPVVGAEAKKTKEPDMVPRSDLDKEVSQKEAAQVARDEAIRGMLNGAQQQQVPQVPIVPNIEPDDGYKLDGLPADTDPEVATLLSSVLSVERRKIEADMQTRFGPAIERYEREASMDDIDKAVPGFKKELMGDVEKLFRELSPEKQKEYDNRIGIEALAAKARLRRLESGLQSESADMAFNAPPRNTKQSTSETVSAENVWDLSDEEFDILTERVRTTGGG